MNRTAQIHNVGGKVDGGTPAYLGKWTFQYAPLRAIVEDTMHGAVLNACAGKTRLSRHAAESIHRNDLNSDRDVDTYRDVITINQQLSGPFDTVIFDPPFDQQQADEHYEGMHARDITTARDALDDLLAVGGTFVECGWNQQSVAVNRSYDRRETHLFARGPCLQPFILTIDEKQQRTLTEACDG